MESEPAYDVIWNGAHRGINADLLCDGLPRESVEPVAPPVVPVVPMRRSSQIQMTSVSSALAGASNLTHRELMRQTGLSFWQVKHVLEILRCRKQLGSCPHRPAGGRYRYLRGRPEKEYWLRQGGYQ